MINLAKIKSPLIIDCQIFQTYSWHRGMGKYSVELLRSLIGQTELEYTAIYLIFSNNATPNPIANKLLKQIAPRAEFIELDLELPKEPRDQFSIQPTRQKNKQVLNAWIDTRFNTGPRPHFLILSLFLDEVCSVFPDSTNIDDRLLLYYDSIPYLYHKRYGQFKGFFDNFYLLHTASLFEATKIFTISKTVANDLRLYFGVLAERIFNINGASIPRASAKPKKPSGWSLPAGSFILMPTGQEIRKNNARTVQAFENFINQSGKDYKLIITSHFNDAGKDDLNKISDKLIFSGNVEESELLWLFQNCRFVLFGSEYEGLGLPVLEAIDENKLIACSDISVFREMSREAFYYFDPLDVESITQTLHKVDNEVSDGQMNHKEYNRIRQNYTWQRTAQEVIKGIQAEVNVPIVKKKKIAIFSPDPSGFSAIGKDIGELHAWYSCFFDIEYYFDKGPNHFELRPNILKYAAPCHAAEDFRAIDYDRFDAVVYHIGNSEYHLNIIRAALVFPGYMVLHDTDLSGAYHNLVEMGYMTNQRYEIEGILDIEAGKNKKLVKNSTFITSLVNSQHVVITHSSYAQKAVQTKMINNVPVEYFELPFDTPIFTDINSRLSRNKVSIAFAGIIAKIKGIDLMESIALSNEFTDCQINIFGFSAVETEQLKKLRQLPNVTIMTNPTDFEFQQKLADSDILVNVRLAYRGETSGSTLSHMRYGGIALVRDFGWFSELPDDTVIKVTKPEDTLPALHNIVRDNQHRQQLHEKSIRYMQNHHSHKAYAKDMYDLLKNRPAKT